MRGDSKFSKAFFLEYGDVCDFEILVRLLQRVKPVEIYNLAAQSSVQLSFEHPLVTMKSVGLGVMNLLEAVRHVDSSIKVFQASSSEIFGQNKDATQNEKTGVHPCSPYATAKLMAFHAVRMYREAYGLMVCSGILFNHESCRRGANFVTQKIVISVVRIKYGLQATLELGNLDARRDWGHARDFVKCIWQMLQHPPDDYVVATGITHTVREFVTLAFKAVGTDIVYEGQGLNERGLDRTTGRTLLTINPSFFRPLEPCVSVGDASKARRTLGWKPTTNLEQLIFEMVAACEARYEC